MPKLTICGGGNAAHVLIALAGQAGWTVDVFTPLAGEAERLRAGGGITARLAGRSFVGRARCISAEPGEVIPGSELVLLALPAFAHGPTLQAIAGLLEPGVALGALPARSGFDYQARSLLSANDSSVRLFGLQTLPWACRIVTYGQTVDILGSKAEVDLAALPAGAAPGLAGQLGVLLGLKLNPVASFLTLSLANTGQLVHPGIMYGLCRGREEATFTAADIPLFYQGVDQPTADLLQALDDEVQLVAGVLAAQLPDFEPDQVVPLQRWLLRAYPTDIADGTTLRRAFVTNRAYAGLRLPTRPAGPDTFSVDYTSRYLAEDVPYGLVVLRGLAELSGASTPTLDQVIAWAQARLGRRYLAGGSLSGPDLAETRAPQVYGLRTPAQLW